MPDFIAAILFLGFLGGVGLTFLFLFLSNSVSTIEEKRPFVKLALWSFLVGIGCLAAIILGAYIQSRTNG